MSPAQRRLTIVLWALVVVALVGAVAARLLIPRERVAGNARGTEMAMLSSDERISQSGRELFAAPELKLTDQDGRPFSTAQLRGRPWIADFIFTTCGSLCPIMSHQMAELQKQTPGEVGLVSFTVDPEKDSPPVLKAYGEALHADFGRWHFLTGTPRQMADAEYAMKISVEPATANAQIVHSNKFLLVNGDGKVVGVYDGTDAGDVKRLAADASHLAGGSLRH